MTMTVRRHMVGVNGIRLHVAEAGEGPPVVLLHGYPETWHAWRLVSVHKPFTETHLHMSLISCLRWVMRMEWQHQFGANTRACPMSHSTATRSPSFTSNPGSASSGVRTTTSSPQLVANV
jgi:hypothetical protein